MRKHKCITKKSKLSPKRNGRSKKHKRKKDGKKRRHRKRNHSTTGASNEHVPPEITSKRHGNRRNHRQRRPHRKHTKAEATQGWHVYGKNDRTHKVLPSHITSLLNSSPVHDLMNVRGRWGITVLTYPTIEWLFDLKNIVVISCYARTMQLHLIHEEATSSKKLLYTVQCSQRFAWLHTDVMLKGVERSRWLFQPRWWHNLSFNRSSIYSTLYCRLIVIFILTKFNTHIFSYFFINAFCILYYYISHFCWSFMIT